MSLIDDAAAIQPELSALRRELHQDPEVGLELPRTQQRVLAALEGLPLEITLGTRTTSVTAVLRGGRPGPAVLLRGDMDALPLTEETGLDYASTNGAMHACGHDLHTAGLVGAAKLLSAHKDDLAGSVIFMFQPGEEGWNGATVMIEEGVLDAAGAPPVAAYALHVGPGPKGQVGIKPGTMAASSSTLHITINGRGGHGSMPQGAADPVPAIAQLTTELQVMIARRLDAQDPVVLSVTQLHAGGPAINVIPPSATLGATVRCNSNEALAQLPGLIEEVAHGIAAAHGCTAEVEFETEYIPTINDAAESQFAVTTLTALAGADRVAVMDRGAMASEDFSFVLDRIPGVMLSVSASPDGLDPATAGWNHSPIVQFDDSILGFNAALLAELAAQRLASASEHG